MKQLRLQLRSFVGDYESCTLRLNALLIKSCKHAARSVLHQVMISYHSNKIVRFETDRCMHFLLFLGKQDELRKRKIITKLRDA